jgi:hypothetical protein
MTKQMKKPLAALAALFLMVPALPVQAGYSQGGGVRQRECYKEIYREEYIPGTKDRPGRVRRWTETKKVPCKGNQGNRGNRGNHRPVDENSCVEGSILGGIAGAAAGAALSRDDGRWIGIPLGIVGGSLVGCQLDGG